MKKFRLLGLFLSVFLVFTFAGNAWTQDDGYGAMRPDPETLRRWMEASEKAPKALIEKEKGKVSKYVEMINETIERINDLTSTGV